MVELIAKNTIQRVLDGKFVSHAPDTRFEMLDADAEQLVRIRAAVYANPQDVVPVQAPIQLPATDAPAQLETATEPAPVDAVAASEAELEADVAEPEAAPKPATVDAVAASEPDIEAELKAEPAAAPKRTRKAKTEVTE